MDSLCWVGSICPNGDLKPACGCQGYRRGKRGTLRTSKTVLDRIVRLIMLLLLLLCSWRAVVRDVLACNDHTLELEHIATTCALSAPAEPATVRPQSQLSLSTSLPEEYNTLRRLGLTGSNDIDPNPYLNGY